MKILFRCTGCNQKLRASAAPARRKAACPACKTRMIIPPALTLKPDSESLPLASGTADRIAHTQASPVRAWAALSRQWFLSGLGSGLAAGLIAGFGIGSVEHSQTAAPKMYAQSPSPAQRTALRLPDPPLSPTQPESSHSTVHQAPLAVAVAPATRALQVEQPFGTFHEVLLAAPAASALPQVIEPAAPASAPVVQEPQEECAKEIPAALPAPTLASAPTPTPPLQPSTPPALHSSTLAPTPANSARETGRPSTAQAPQPPAAGGPLQEELKSARDVQARVNDRYRGDDMKLTMSLVLTNSRGEQRTNELVRYRKRENGLVQSVYRFVGPADLRGTTTLTLEQRGEGDDLQWMYLPALKKLRRIASADRGKSWAGTDFCYEDLREKKLSDYAYSELSSEKVGAWDCYHYSMTPYQRGALALQQGGVLGAQGPLGIDQGQILRQERALVQGDEHDGPAAHYGRQE